MSREYQERIRPIKRDGIRSIEAQIGRKEKKVDRLKTFFESDKNSRTIKGLEKEITKLEERLEKRIGISQ